MTKTKFTPGPWAWMPEFREVKGQDEYVLEYVKYEGLYLFNPHDGPMIAAAPEMYAALDDNCKKLIEFRDSVLHGRHQLDGEGFSSDQINAILGLFDDLFDAEKDEAILAKVRGEE